MNEADSGLEIVATTAGGWCDSESGVCHIDPDDEASAMEESNGGDASDES